MNIKIKFVNLLIISCTILSLSARSDVSNHQTTTKNQESEKEEIINREINNFLTKKKYHLVRFSNLTKFVNEEAVKINESHFKSAYNEWLASVQIREGDLVKINFFPSMLSEKHIEKFRQHFNYADREDILDKLRALEYLLSMYKHELDSIELGGLITTRFYLTNNPDRSIDWLKYFIEENEVNVNNYKKRSLMSEAIQANNVPAAQLLKENGYQTTDLDL